MINAHIVVIEDEEDLLELYEYHLQKEGYEVSGFLSSSVVRDFLFEESVDLLIVDRNLPNIEGSEFVKSLRDEGYDMPVIFVSAKGSYKDIEEGFLRGGDDYLTKPFNMKELLLRVRSILKRASKVSDDIIAYKDVRLDLNKRVCSVDGKDVVLSKLEFDLLLYFMQHRGVVLDRNELLQEVWMDDESKQEKSVNVAINRLRKKIDPDRTKGYIEPIRGIGYKFC